MEKTVTYDGVQYVVRRRTNANEANSRYFKRMLALMYKQIAIECGLDEDQVATVLLDYAQISGQVTGGTALLKRGDSDAQFHDKFVVWLMNDNLFELSQLLTESVNDVNEKPDRALAPEPLPENADPKV